jgi:hypothetical protein
MYQICHCKRETGIEPPNLFLDALNIFKFTDDEKTGKVPTKLLSLKSIQRSTAAEFSNCPIEAGIEPVKLFSSRKSDSSFDSVAIESGIVPSNLLLSEETIDTN